MRLYLEGENGVGRCKRRPIRPSDPRQKPKINRQLRSRHLAARIGLQAFGTFAASRKIGFTKVQGVGQQRLWVQIDVARGDHHAFDPGIPIGQARDLLQNDRPVLKAEDIHRPIVDRLQYCIGGPVRVTVKVERTGFLEKTDDESCRLWRFWRRGKDCKCRRGCRHERERDFHSRWTAACCQDEGHDEWEDPSRMHPP